jgi:hypothetical protein
MYMIDTTMRLLCVINLNCLTGPAKKNVLPLLLFVRREVEQLSD